MPIKWEIRDRGRDAISAIYSLVPRFSLGTRLAIYGIIGASVSEPHDITKETERCQLYKSINGSLSIS